jgi:predicted MFS family arabinose efflux permease
VFGGLMVDRLGPLSAPAYGGAAALIAVGLVLVLRRTGRRPLPATVCEACS